MFSELFLKEGEATYKDAKGARKVLAHPLFGTVSMVLIGCILLGALIFEMMAGDSPDSLKSVSGRAMLKTMEVYG